MEIGTDVSTTRRVVSARAARQMTLMMERVVDPDVGVAPLANVPGYRVAGKTGTAQRVGTCGTGAAKHSCYDGTNTVSFAGFAPADDPRFTVYVVVQDRRRGRGRWLTAGPVFSSSWASRSGATASPRATASRRSCPSSGRPRDTGRVVSAQTRPAQPRHDRGSTT